jgi:hypothetical protein
MTVMMPSPIIIKQLIMKKIHFLSDNIITPLGNSSEENFNAILSGKSGVVEHVKPCFQNNPFLRFSY